MRECDGRTHREICELFKWANTDSFWYANIQSPRKLREKWDDLFVRSRGCSQVVAQVDNTERDGAYRRFIGSGLPLKNPSALEIEVRREAGKAGIKTMRVDFAVSTWNRLWKDCASRGEAA
ncbi:phage replication protein [Photorhabdus temperata subsp. temperata M1021]|nr:phage replication protein [Photorhabdus temperata subsp. temperata M1021]